MNRDSSFEPSAFAPVHQSVVITVQPTGGAAIAAAPGAPRRRKVRPEIRGTKVQWNLRMRDAILLSLFPNALRNQTVNNLNLFP
ncbi:MAG: hypothetical protein JWM32_1969 [Verrucomicrobia bacterium]|nr:hypothetical protein [Verrucomicrobiota bacterium]